MTTLEIILLIYILQCNVWTIIFVNVKKGTRHKLWFILLTFVFMPISSVFIAVSVWLEERKNEK